MDQSNLNIKLVIESPILEAIKKQLIESTDRILKRISALEKQVSQNANQERKRDAQMADTLDDIFVEVEKNSTVGMSIITLVERLLTQQGVDPARRAAIISALKSDTERLEAVVLANTPAEPPTE